MKAIDLQWVALILFALVYGAYGVVLLVRSMRDLCRMIREWRETGENPFFRSFPVE